MPSAECRVPKKIITSKFGVPCSIFDIQGVASPEEILRKAQHDGVDADQKSAIKNQQSLTSSTGPLERSTLNR